MFAKDTPEVHSFWNCWHNEWLTGEKKGVGIDQPSLGKANCLSNHIIKNLSDEWNTLVYMNPIFIEDAKILHFWQFRNRSLMFCEPYLEYVKVHGVDDYVKRCMLNPLASVLPSDNVLKSYTIRRWLKLIIIVKQELKLFVKQIGEISSTPWFDKFNKIETAFLKCKLYGFTSVLYFMRRFLHVKIGKNKNKNLKVCFS